jgi:hypothetical protein
MADRPILFRREMREAIAAGVKTQTRRLVAPSNSSVLGYTAAKWIKKWWAGAKWKGAVPTKRGDRPWADGECATLNVPCGLYPDPPDDAWYRVRSRVEVGDRLWVKEKLFQRKEDTRLWLRVAAVRVERVQSISGSDAGAEGVTFHDMHVEGHGRPVRVTRFSCDSMLRDVFAHLWDSINGERGTRWCDDPMVVAIRFRRAAT